MRLWGVGLAILLEVTLSAVAFCQSWDDPEPSTLIPGTAMARQSDRSLGWIARLPVEALKPVRDTSPEGVTMSARIVRSGKDDQLLWELRWEPGSPWGAGTWVAFRDGLGRIREVRVLLLGATSSDERGIKQSGTWVRLVPQGKTARMDLFLAGSLVSGGWTVAASLVDILQSEDGWLWNQTAKFIDWPEVYPQHRWEDEKTEVFRSIVHRTLATMPYSEKTLWIPSPKGSKSGTDDVGAPWGRWVVLGPGQGLSSRGLGPWGTSAWIASGLIRSWGGAFPPPESLWVSRTQLPGYSEALVPEDPVDDPAFGLDWTRNLGLALQATLYPDRPISDRSSDLHDVPYLTSVTDAGYSLDDAPALWQLLAVNHPGVIYLASRSHQNSSDQGQAGAVSFGNPVVVMPWVDKNNRLRVVVYDGPKEYGWDEWMKLTTTVTRGTRADHLMLTAFPLPNSPLLPVLPIR